MRATSICPTVFIRRALNISNCLSNASTITASRAVSHHKGPSSVVKAPIANTVKEERPSSSLSLKQHPMEVLTEVFKLHPSALRLHRELTISLARGDAEQAADLAAVLANTVRRVTSSVGSKEEVGEPQREKASVEDKQEGDTPPAPLANDLAEAMEKTRGILFESLRSDGGALGGQSARSSSPASAQSRNAEEERRTVVPFWRSPAHLCITMLESTFETTVPSDEENPLTEAGQRALTHEERQLIILDEYLEHSGDHWKAQKAAVAKIVVDVARTLNVTPEDLHVSEGGREVPASAGQRQHHGHHLNALKHCNIIIRCEAPEAISALATAGGSSSPTSSTTLSDLAQAKALKELAVLKERMTSHGAPLSLKDEEVALYELVMSNSTMRYVVGLHTDLQRALDTSEGIKRAMAAVAGAAKDSEGGNGDGNMTGSAFFVNEVIHALHKTSEAIEQDATQGNEGDLQATEELTVERVEAARVLAMPVLPFTFMLKCCLWFEMPHDAMMGSK